MSAKSLLPAVTERVRQFANEREALIEEETASWGSARRKAQAEFRERTSKMSDEASQKFSERRTKAAEEARARLTGALRAKIKYPNDYSGSLKVTVDFADPKLEGSS